jgi:hypothetical protein
MKKCLVFFVFFLTSVFLYAQNFREPKIFITPVSGLGRVGDNAFFYRLLSHEVMLLHHSLVRLPRNSDFTLRAGISPYTGTSMLGLRDITMGEEAGDSLYADFRGNIEFFDAGALSTPVFARPGEPVYDGYSPWQQPARETEIFMFEYDEADPFTAGNEYLFYLELLDSNTGRLLAEQEFIYTSIDATVHQLLSIIVYNMLAGIPDIDESNEWRDKWLFFTASFLWTPRIYSNLYESVHLANFGAGISVQLQFLNFLAAEVGFEFVQDWVIVSPAEGDNYRDVIVEIPLTLRYVYKPDASFILEPFLGVQYNFSAIGTTKPNLISWLVGLQLGIKAGPGIFIIEPRFVRDTDISFITHNSQEFARQSLKFGIGYKYGLVPRR